LSLFVACISLLLFPLLFTIEVGFFDSLLESQAFHLRLFLLFEELLTSVLASLLDRQLARQTRDLWALARRRDCGGSSWGFSRRGSLISLSRLKRSSSLLSSFELLGSLALLVLLLLQLLVSQLLWLLLCLPCSAHLLVILDLLLGSGRGALSSLGSKSLLLFTLLLLNNGVLLLSHLFDGSETLLPLSLHSEFGLALCLEGCTLTLTLLLHLLLFLLLEDLLELANGAAMLLGELLQLGAVLLLLLALLGPLVLIFLAHQLGHQLVSLHTRVIVDLLALFDDFGASSVAHLLGNRQRGVTFTVAIEDVHLRVLNSVLEHVDIARVLRSQV